MAARSAYSLSDYQEDRGLIWRVQDSGVLKLPDGPMKSGVAREILASYKPVLRGFQGMCLAVREEFARERNLQLACDRRVYAALLDTYEKAYEHVVLHRKEMKQQERNEERSRHVTLLEKIEAELAQRTLDFEENQPHLGNGVVCGCFGYPD